MRNFINDYFLSNSNHFVALFVVYMLTVMGLMFLTVWAVPMTGLEVLVLYYCCLTILVFSGMEVARILGVESDKRREADESFARIIACIGNNY